MCNRQKHRVGFKVSNTSCLGRIQTKPKLHGKNLFYKVHCPFKSAVT